MECESWNNGKLVGHKHPGLWHVISCIQKDQLAMLTELERVRIGDPTKKRNHRHTVTLQERLKSLCEKLNSNEKILHEFLHAVGHCIRFFKNGLFDPTHVCDANELHSVAFAAYKDLEQLSLIRFFTFHMEKA